MNVSEPFAPFMAEAIKLAEKGRFHTCPNPTVGAVLVKDGQIVARGWHKAFGAPHAEIECLEDARKNNVDFADATLVVTLEPCSHHGKTPPCTDAIMASGIRRVVYGTTDPNKTACGGAGALADMGLEVIGPVLEQECNDLVADFRVWQTTTRPYVYLKLASTLDGRIATRTGHSRWISNPRSRANVHTLREGIGLAGGAVLIGGGTFRADDPQLSARLEENGPQPLACILTSRLPQPDADFKLLNQRPEQTIFFASPAAAASTKAEDLRKKGCRVIAIGPNVEGRPDFATLFTLLRKDFDCHYVLCEGGGRLALSLLEGGYIDEFHLYLAPLILGDNEARPLFSGRAPLSLDEALGLRVCETRLTDGDIRMVLRPLSRKG